MRTILASLVIVVALGFISPTVFAQRGSTTTSSFVNLVAQDTNCFFCQNPTIHPGDIINVNMGWSPGLTEFDPTSIDCGPFNYNWFVPGSCSGDIELSGYFGTLSTPLPVSGTCNISSSPFQFFNPPLFVTTYAQPGTYVITASVFACQPDPDFQHDVPSGVLLATTTLTITVVPNVVPQYIQGQMLSPSGAPTQPILTTDPSAQTAHVPLGSTFQLTLEQQNADGSFSQVPSSFTLGNANLAFPLDPGALFPNNVVFNYAPDSTQPGTLSFQAVHNGTQSLSINPQDGSPGTQITISVEDPAPPDSSNLAELGSTHPEVDSLIIPIADGKGIPPQYIKGQMERESGGQFNPLAYRYEPLNSDVGDYGKISRHQDWRSSTDPYFHYRLATQADCVDPALAQGDQLLSADVSPPGLYADIGHGKIGAYNGCTPTGCNGISAWDLIQNNLSQNWQIKSPAAYQRLLSAQRAGNSCGYLWTAQTGLAASYGYMQVTYATAITPPLLWQGVDTGAKNPGYLFDTPGNIVRGGGSVEMGTTFITSKLQKIHSADVNNPQFDAVSDFQDIFLDAWAAYNGNNGGDPYAYAHDVLNRSESYLPNASSPMFGGIQ